MVRSWNLGTFWQSNMAMEINGKSLMILALNHPFIANLARLQWVWIMLWTKASATCLVVACRHWLCWLKTMHVWVGQCLKFMLVDNLGWLLNIWFCWKWFCQIVDSPSGESNGKENIKKRPPWSKSAHVTIRFGQAHRRCPIKPGNIVGKTGKECTPEGMKENIYNVQETGKRKHTHTYHIYSIVFWESHCPLKQFM